MTSFRPAAVLSLALLGSSMSALALPVIWVDWTSGSAGPSSSAAGVLTLGSETVNVGYTGEIAFIQTSGGTNYYNPAAPYMSALVDNAPGTSDIIALSTATSKTLTFDKPIDNLFFAVVSLNGNGYSFDEDFEIVSTGCGYWGCGTLTKQLVGSQFELDGAGEPHGVIRFTGAVSSITWTSLTNEFWNGFTVGTYGLAPPTQAPEPETYALIALGLAAMGVFVRRRQRR